MSIQPIGKSENLRFTFALAKSMIWLFEQLGFSPLRCCTGIYIGVVLNIKRIDYLSY